MFRAFILGIPILSLILGISTGYKLSRGPISMILLTILFSGLYLTGLCVLAVNGLALTAITLQSILNTMANLVQSSGSIGH